MAARVCGLSGPDEILVSDPDRATRSTTVDDVRFVDRGEHVLKGIAAPQRVYAFVEREQRTASRRSAGVGRAPMGSMPNWFAKTKEMAAFDRYFSTARRRREGAARPLPGRRWPACDGRRLLQPRRRARPRVARARRTAASRMRMSLDEHFRGDWIHHQYPDDP